MRIITIAPELLAQLFAVAEGPFVDIPVSVAWPELQLTTDQRLANSISALQGQAPPHDDPGVFLLRLPVVKVPEKTFDWPSADAGFAGICGGSGHDDKPINIGGGGTIRNA